MLLIEIKYLTRVKLIISKVVFCLGVNRDREKMFNKYFQYGYYLTRVKLLSLFIAVKLPLLFICINIKKVDNTS